MRDTIDGEVRKGSGVGSWWLRHLRALVVAAVLAMLVHALAFRTYRVASDSMAPALVAGDQVLVDKVVFGVPLPVVGVRLPALRAPRVGDVLLFRHPDDPSELYVKRCAGVVGDRVTLSVVDVSVPDDMLFMLGDNASDSSDSREWGFLPRDLVIGRVTRIVWSAGRDGLRWNRLWHEVPEHAD